MQNLRVLIIVSNISLVVGFISHLLIRFRRANAQNLLFPWLLFWIALLGQYLVRVSSLLGAYEGDTYWRIGESLLDLLQSFLLLYVAALLARPQALDSSHRRKLFWRTTLWSVPVAATAFVLILRENPGGTLLASYFSFITLCLYAGRWAASSVPPPATWVLILLYVYAGYNLGLWPTDQYVVLFSSLSVPLKVILYYSCYRSLLDLAPNPVPKLVEGSRPNSRRVQPEPRRSVLRNVKNRVSDSSPVEVHLNDFWGFLYLLWQNPSGQFVAFVTLVSLVLGAFYVLKNLSQVVEIWKMMGQ